MDEISEIKREIKYRKSTNKNKPRNSNTLLKLFIIKTLILILVGIIVLIFIKKDEKNKELIYKYVFENNISFASINTIYKKYLGNILPFDNFAFVNSQVFNESLVYKSLNKYKEGVSLTVENNYLVPCMEGGIVTFIGKKDDYGKTVIIESEDIVIWYGNLDTISVNLYDNISEGMFLGETLGEKLYLVFKRDGKVINYKEYM